MAHGPDPTGRVGIEPRRAVQQRPKRGKGMEDRIKVRLREDRRGHNLLFSGIAMMLVGVIASTSRADVLLFNPTGGGASGAIPISGCDEKSGNASAKGVIQNGTITIGETFTRYYQASVASLLGPKGEKMDLPANTRISVLAGFTEQVTDLHTSPISGQTTATFRLAPTQTTNFGNFYESNTPLSASDATGQNFALGNLFLPTKVDPTSNNSGTFTRDFHSVLNIAPGNTQQSVTGSGSMALNIHEIPGSALAGYFPDDTLTPVLALDFPITTSLPFPDGVPPSSGFNSTGTLNDSDSTPALGAINDVAGPDFPFGAHAIDGFSTPERSSIALTAMGLVGLVGLGWRKRMLSQA
jgi:hypothetical protein